MYGTEFRSILDASDREAEKHPESSGNATHDGNMRKHKEIASNLDIYDVKMKQQEERLKRANK